LPRPRARRVQIGSEHTDDARKTSGASVTISGRRSQ
jgi:hypothetical protein